MLPIPAPPIPQILQRLSHKTLAELLNRVFSTALADGELDFLERQVLRVVVSGTGISFNLALADDVLVVTSGTGHWDLRISGSPYDFMLLAARREDADTLFFQRRLKTEGNTELGLFLKNFLDAQDLSDLPYADLFDTGLSRAIDLYEWLSPIRNRLLR